MAIIDLYIDTCNVLRFTSTQDVHGQLVKTWSTVITDEPCRFTYPNNNEVKRETEVVIADFKLFMPVVTVTERDRISADGIIYEILSVILQRGLGGDHLELMLRTVR